MAVTATTTKGTIGGGALEHRAIQRARALLREGAEAGETLALGPGLGQCCGGSVTLKYTFQPQNVDLHHFGLHPIVPNRPHPRHVWLWGAGHVGRAFVRMGGMQAFKFTWVDDAETRFPEHVPDAVRKLVAADMPRLACRAEQQADHLIFTYSHDIDLALCATLLQREVRSIGLIGSDTKWTRFSKRLRAMGLDPDGITCPIGDKTLGKHPDRIAQGTLAQLMAPSEASA